ncbi:MAG TPA: NUDIX hydrolase [Acidimicrobiaceae bacterium]|nr:NUDIX hydrolase [Acidimicrobiaceae bacterium]
MPACCVGGIALWGDKLLLIRRANPPGQGYWSIPGGHVEPGETWQEAVEREVLEETGLRATCGRFVGWVERSAGDNRYLIADFMVEVFAPETAAAADDAADLTFADVEDMKLLELAPGLLSFLNEHGVLAS